MINIYMYYARSMLFPSFSQEIIGFGKPFAAQSKVKFFPFRITAEFGGVATNLGGEIKFASAIKLRQHNQRDFIQQMTVSKKNSNKFIKRNKHINSIRRSNTNIYL